ncbi:hypothetical protein K8T06_02665 [bacterium]|nr:hypothetical protein [bacterium]
MVLDRFTDTAKRLITLARARAEERQHGSLSNEHLLEVVLEAPDCIAYQLIMGQLPCVEFINRELHLRLSKVKNTGQGGINFDDSCKKTFERVFLLSDKLEHTGISTGSLILGMLQAESPVTAPMLRNWGLSIKNVHLALVEAGDPGSNEAGLLEISKNVISQVDSISEMSEDAFRVIAHAQELAKSCSNIQINAHHFLLSMVFLATRGIIDIPPLDSNTLDIARAKDIVTGELKGKDTFVENQITFDSSLHKIFKIAALEVFQAGEKSISTAEMALALLQVIPEEAASGLGYDYFSLKWSSVGKEKPKNQQETLKHKPVIDMLIPRISLRRYNADQSIVILIPEKLARDWQVMAIDSRDNTLTVAMVDPFNKETIAQIEDLTGLSVAVIKAEAKDLFAAYRINY